MLTVFVRLTWYPGMKLKTQQSNMLQSHFLKSSKQILKSSNKVFYFSITNYLSSNCHVVNQYISKTKANVNQFQLKTQFIHVASQLCQASGFSRLLLTHNNIENHSLLGLDKYFVSKLV